MLCNVTGVITLNGSTLFSTDGDFPPVLFLFMMKRKKTITPQRLYTQVIVFERRKLILMSNDISVLTGIKDPNLRLDVQGIQDSDTLKVIHLIQTGDQNCPVCGHRMLKNGFRKVMVRGLKVAEVPVMLVIRKQKYLCKPSPECPQTVTKMAEIKGITPSCRIADNVKQSIITELPLNISQKDLANRYQVSPSTVGRIIDSLEERFKPQADWLPAAIAFDDFKSGRFATSGMSMLLMNPVNHRTIDIIQSRNNHYLRQYFYRRFTAHARQGVRLVVVDLYQPYRRLIKELFPNARIIADHFHVVAQAYRALQAIRIHAMNRYGSGTREYRALKHFWKLITQKGSRLDYLHFRARRNFQGAWLTNSEVIDRLLAMDDDLAQAYDYYQRLIDAVEHQDRVELTALLAEKLTSLPLRLRKVQRTLRQHKAEILLSFQHHLSNGPIEGTNNKIKVIKRTAYGFRNFWHFRLRILLALKNSHLMVIQRPKQKASPSSQAA